MNSDIFHTMNKVDAEKDTCLEGVRCYAFMKNGSLYRLGRNFDKHYFNVRMIYSTISHIQTAAAAEGVSVKDVKSYKSGSGDIMSLKLSDFRELKAILDDELDIYDYDTESIDPRGVRALVFAFEVAGERVVLFKKVGAVNTEKTAYSINFDGELSDYLLHASFTVDSTKPAFTVIINDDMYVLNVAQFESVFKVTPSVKVAAQRVAEQITDYYSIESSLIGTHFDMYIESRPPLLKRLAALEECELPSFDTVMEVVEEFDLDIMPKEDYSGLIIMNAVDVSTLIDIIEDNFVSGVDDDKKYLARNKKEIL